MSDSIDWPVLTLPQEESRHLHAVYQSAKVILEYGSGGSSIVASRLPGKFIISVESDRNWARGLQQKIHMGDLPSPAIIYHADIGPTGAWGRPVDDKSWRKFHRYPISIWNEPFFRQPDVILIDGRFRPACFVNACLRIRQPVTILFDDYVNRPAYHVVEHLVAPRRTIGRMAEFRVEPREWPIAVHEMLMDLCTAATFSTEKNISYAKAPAIVSNASSLRAG